MNQLIKGSHLVQLVTSAAGAAGTSAINSSTIDFANYDGALIIAQFGPIVAGAATSLKLQDGTTTTPATDVAGSNITVLDTDDNTLKVYDVRRPINRYMRLVVSRATQNATVTAVAILYNGRNRPDVQSTTDLTTVPVVLVSPAEGTP